MLAEPECYRRKCIHFLGVIKPDGVEIEKGERVNCSAFPMGIPDEIAYGDNLHLKPLPKQKNKIIFKKLYKYLSKSQIT